MSTNTIVYVGNPNTFSFYLMKSLLECYGEGIDVINTSDVIDTNYRDSFYKEFYEFIDTIYEQSYEKVIFFDTTYESLQTYASYKGVTWYSIPNIRKEVE